MEQAVTLCAHQLQADISESMALRDISFELSAGEVIVVIGPNGAGKTSLLRALCNELDLTGGSVQFNNKSLPLWSARQRARTLAVLPQRYSLEFPFTVTEVVLMGRIPHDTSSSRNAEIAAAALALVDCAQFAERFYVNLSGGEKQRVQLARVLAQVWDEQEENRCLLLDEPSSSLDLAHQELIVEGIRRFAQQGVAVLTVLHDLNLASKCADRLLVLDAGSIVASGSPAEVVTESMLASIFGVEAMVSTHSRDGSPVVIT